MPRFLSKTTMRKAVDGALRRATGEALKRLTREGVRLDAATHSDANRVKAALDRFGIEHAVGRTLRNIVVPYSVNVQRKRAKAGPRRRRNPSVGVCLGCGKRKRLAYSTPQGGVCREAACVKRVILPRVAAQHARDALDAVGAEPAGVLCPAGEHRNDGTWLEYAERTGSCPRCEIDRWRATLDRRNPRYVNVPGDDLGARYPAPTRAVRRIVLERAREAGDLVLALQARMSLGDSLARIARSTMSDAAEADLAARVLARGSVGPLWTKPRAVAAVAKAYARLSRRA